MEARLGWKVTMCWELENGIAPFYVTYTSNLRPKIRPDIRLSAAAGHENSERHRRTVGPSYKPSSVWCHPTHISAPQRRPYQYREDKINGRGKEGDGGNSKQKEANERARKKCTRSYGSGIYGLRWSIFFLRETGWSVARPILRPWPNGPNYNNGYWRPPPPRIGRHTQSMQGSKLWNICRRVGRSDFDITTKRKRRWGSVECKYRNC